MDVHRTGRVRIRRCKFAMHDNVDEEWKMAGGSKRGRGVDMSSREDNEGVRRRAEIMKGGGGMTRSNVTVLRFES